MSSDNERLPTFVGASPGRGGRRGIGSCPPAGSRARTCRDCFVWRKLVAPVVLAEKMLATDAPTRWGNGLGCYRASPRRGGVIHGGRPGSPTWPSALQASRWLWNGVPPAVHQPHRRTALCCHSLVWTSRHSRSWPKNAQGQLVVTTTDPHGGMDAY